MKFKIAILLLVFISIVAKAQHFVLDGKVIDSDSKEPLPFVNISIAGSAVGTTSGIDGRFHLALEKEAVLIFSYVGYEKEKLEMPFQSSEFIIVELKVAEKILETVEVIAGENPAFRIIRKVLENRSKNDPENLKSFSYKGYHKFYATVEGAFDEPSDTTGSAKFLKKNHLFINESFTERKYLKPNHDKETVLGNRMSGVEDPFFAILATSFQPFTFYKQHITLFDKNYLNPISQGSLEKYDFEIADTIFRNSDTTFIIPFEPLRGKTFEGLKGVLYISTNRYAIEHVLAEPADPQSLMNIKIQQKYFFSGGHWFPNQLNTEFILREYKIANHNVKYVHRSYITDVTINPLITKKEFGLLNVEFDPIANHQNEKFWDQIRSDSLTAKERNTYKLYDTLDRKTLATLNSLVKIGEAFAVGKFKAGSFYIPTESIIRANEYEDLRIGLGLQTGEKISRLVTLDGYIAYGIKDRAVKYGGGLQFNLKSSQDLFLKLSYRQDIFEPGNSNFIKNPITASGGQSLRNWLSSRMDSVRQYKALLNFRPLHFSEASLFIQQNQHHPTYGYGYRINDGSLKKDYTITEAGFQFRYVLRENYAQIGSNKVVTNQAYPRINFSASQALNFWNGQFQFVKAELKIEHEFLTGAAGRTRLQLATGTMKGNAPYFYLFNGKGSHLDNKLLNSWMVPDYFQTMGLYEFVSDQYVYLFLNHNFGRLTTTRNKHFRPELIMVHNMGVGKLKNLIPHEGINIQTMEKGFFESGLAMKNLLRFEYARLVYIGLGGGVFYRYGYYAFDQSTKNIMLKLMVNMGL